MAERTNVRSTDPKDFLVFHDMHEPVLENSDYTLSFSHTLDPRTGDAAASGAGELHLRVVGPQLSLPTGSVVATFPANLSADRYYSVLPHALLSRGTLPWERDPRATGRGKAAARKDALPWLALLILDEDELSTGVASTSPARISTVPAKKMPPEIASGDTHDDDMVTLLELDAAMATSLLPPLADLPWLAHVRRVEPPTGPPEPETSTVVASRLPSAGKQNHALLVSVEGRYRRASFDTAGQARVTLPVLHQWSFFCEAEPAHGFIELLTKRDGTTNDPVPFTITDSTASSAVQARTNAGFIPVEHRLRNGDVSAAWYHGPLLPGRPPVDTAFIETKLPSDHADHLLLLDEEFAMFDASYASAWELGRMLALEHTDTATALYHWKRAFSHITIRAGQGQSVHAAQVPSSQQQLPPMPAEVARWIREGLIELRDVPFRNLVPDEDLLPPSSFRFFDIDAGWVECLRDGAISVGRTDGRTRELEHEMRKHLPTPPEMSGFLLRNSAVTDFPHLEVDGYTAAPKIESFAKASLPVLRMDRLSPSVLLVIFEGRVKTVDLHLHPQALHFGVQLVDGTPGAEKFEKDNSAGTTITIAHAGTTTPAPLVPMNAVRRIDMSELAAKLHVRSGDGRVADFASSMLEGVPLVRFSRSLGGS